MTRHGRNATNSAVYTYHERKKDAAASGYGTDKCRLSKDSLKGYDCCSLTLQPCKNPVVTAKGWLFEKEAILKFMLEKKMEYKRKLKEYERQKNKEQQELQEIADAEHQSRVQRFEATEKDIVTRKGGSSTAGPSTSTISNMKDEKNRSKLPSFWVPNQTPMASSTKQKKPDKTVYCPMSDAPLKMADFIDVKFTLINDPDNKKSLIAREERYMCPVTHDVLSNSTPCAVLKPTGDVVTVECVEKIIKKDMVHPLTGQILKEEDIIYLQRGGTGYSAANKNLEANHYRPTLAIS